MKQQYKTLLAKRILTALAAVLFPSAIMWGIWYPEIQYHHVPTVTLDPTVTEALRFTPADSILDELSDISYLNLPDEGSLIDEAERILTGRLTVLWEGEIGLTLPFDPDELELGLPHRRLILASLKPVNVLVEAYQQSGREDFLIAARDMLKAFSAYERTALLPKGFLRNDHATAARVGVLTKFWKSYRQHPSYDPVLAGQLLELVYRSGQYLAKPSHFTFQTNHGIMQNIALLQLSLAFPDLPEANHFRSLAMERLATQFDFYLSEEGVVLEHSIGYHADGMMLVGTIFRLVSLADLAVPEDWRQKYERGMVFLNQLRRPDSTLPIIGDTEPGADANSLMISKRLRDGSYGRLSAYQIKRPTADLGLYPVEGYAVWWDGLGAWPEVGRLSQTVVAWSFFRRHGHKQADELGLWFWAGGYDWWSSAGYWPYDTPGEKLSRSWLTSNAPHLTDQNTADLLSDNHSPERETLLLWSGQSERLTALDLQRDGPDQFSARRQIIAIDNSTWLVLDYTSAPDGKQMATAWTVDYRINATKGPEPGTFVLSPPDGNKLLHAYFTGSNNPEITTVNGSDNPLLGWQSVNGEAKATTVIKLTQEADNAWTLASWTLKENDQKETEFKAVPTMNYWHGSENWEIVNSFGQNRQIINRTDENITILDVNGTVKTNLILTKGPEVKEQRQAISSALERADRLYPFYRSTIKSRTKVSLSLLVVFILQELFFLVYRKFTLRFVGLLRITSLTFWTGGGYYILMIYQF